VIGRSISQSILVNTWLVQIALSCALGGLLGLACLLLSPLWTLWGLVGMSLAVAVIKRPEIALLGILLCTSSVLYEEQLPLVPIGVGSLHIPDLLLLGSLGILVIRRLVEPDFRLPYTRLHLPILAFYGAALLATVAGISNGTVEAQIAFREIRVLNYYLTFFVVVGLVQKDQQIRLLVRGFFLLATIVAAAMIAQSLVGHSLPFLPGRVETLVTQGRLYEGVTRIVVPGRDLVLVAFIASTATLVMERFRPASSLKSIQWGLLGLGLLVTFLRSYWAIMAMGLLALALLLKGAARRKLLVGGALLGLLALVVLLIILAGPPTQASRLVEASFDRMATLGNSDTLEESSLQWRYMENRYAWLQIVAHPVLGLGLGARYRPWDPVLEPSMFAGSSYDFDSRRHIHNGHLWIMATTGMLGYAGLVWLSLAFIVRGLKSWRAVADPQFQGIVLGFAVAYLGVVIAAVVNSTFMRWYWTPIIGIMMGVNEIVLRNSMQGSLHMAGDPSRLVLRREMR